jgi:hypothetical protein
MEAAVINKWHRPIGLVACGFLATCAVVALAADPTPTPTPRPAGGQSLSDVAGEKKLKGSGDGKSIVITDKNLSDYASKGQVTAVETGTSNASRRPVRDITTNPNMVVVESDSSHADERRRYWVGMYERQLELVASLKRQIAILDEEIPGLWNDFYSRDDPAYRDGVIKPKLDASLERRERLVQDLAEEEPRLDEIKSDARQQGAEPGWFRGISVPTPVPATPTPGLVID